MLTGRRRKTMMSKEMIVHFTNYRAQEREMAQRNLQMLLTRKQQEEEYNQRIQRSRQGEVVIYGAQIQLQHMDSGAYLQISKLQAE
jgi:hypothetical protein